MLWPYISLALVVVVLLLSVWSFNTGSGNASWGKGGTLTLLMMLVAGAVMFYIAHAPWYQGSGVQKWLTESLDTTSGPGGSSKTPVAPPTGFAFVPATGELTGTVPAGYELVVIYDSASAPLVGAQKTGGKVLGTGTTWTLPTDAANINVYYWDKTNNLVTKYTLVP